MAATTMRFVEVLEGRMLLSASPATHAQKVDSPTIAADKAAIATDRAKIVSDQAALKSTLAADRAAVADTIQTGKTAIAQVRTQIRIDKGNAPALAVDRQTLEAAKAQFRSNVLAARTQIKTDRAAGKATLAADKVQLISDRKKLAADRRAGA